MSDAPDLVSIARDQTQLLAEVGSLRTDMAELKAMLLRFDETVSGLVQDVRALHSRVRNLDIR